MNMTFTISAGKKRYTSETTHNITNWNSGIEQAILYARKMSKLLEEPVKIYSIQRTDIETSVSAFSSINSLPNIS